MSEMGVRSDLVIVESPAGNVAVVVVVMMVVDAEL